MATRVRVAPNAEEEVIAVATDEDFELLVLGASNRTLTNRPFYGHRVSYMIERSPIPVAVISLPYRATANSHR